MVLKVSKTANLLMKMLASLISGSAEFGLAEPLTALTEMLAELLIR